VNPQAADDPSSLAGEAYSFSRVTTFEQCPRRYRYRYVDGVQEGFDSVESFMGRQVHAAIEWLYEQRDRQGGKPTIEQTVAWYCAAWDAAVSGGPRVVRVVKEGTTLEGYRRTGAEMLSRFHQSRFSRDRLVTVGNERYFRVKMASGHEFQGYIDRLARDEDGTLHVIDYKTGRKNGRGFTGKEADQLEAYALAMFVQNPEDEMELVLEFLRLGDRVRKRVARSDAASIERRLTERIRALESSSVFPPNPGVLCRWCGYNDICEGAAGRRLAWP
jgi:putative RecB family exonuclease